MTRIERQLAEVKKWPLRRGKREFINILEGESVTRGKAIAAMCYQCCGGEGGFCTAITCPLYQFSQYRKPTQNT
jgi:hypothetical protein